MRDRGKNEKRSEREGRGRRQLEKGTNGGSGNKEIHLQSNRVR